MIDLIEARRRWAARCNCKNNLLFVRTYSSILHLYSSNSWTPLVIGSAVFPAWSISAAICLKLKMDQRQPLSAIFVGVKSSVSCCVGNQMHVILSPVKGKKTRGDYCKMNSTREKKKVDDSPFPPSHHLIPVNLSQVVSFISSSRDHILKETRGPSNQAFFSVSTDGFKAEIRSKFYRTVQKSMDMKWRAR